MVVKLFLIAPRGAKRCLRPLVQHERGRQSWQDGDPSFSSFLTSMRSFLPDLADIQKDQILKEGVMVEMKCFRLKSP